MKELRRAVFFAGVPRRILCVPFMIAIASCVGDSNVATDGGTDATSNDGSLNDDGSKDAGAATDSGSWCKSQDGAVWCEDFDESTMLPSDVAPGSYGEASAPIVTAAASVSPPNSLLAMATSPSDEVTSFIQAGPFPAPTQNFTIDFDLKCARSGDQAKGFGMTFVSSQVTDAIQIYIQPTTANVVYVKYPIDAGATSVLGNTGNFTCDSSFHHFTLQAAKGSPSLVTMAIEGVVVSEVSLPDLAFGPMYVVPGVDLGNAYLSLDFDNIVLHAK